jgi:hypothetical protein
MRFTIRTRIGLPILSLLFLFSAFAGAQQKTMPPRTQDRPLESRYLWFAKT